MTGLLENVVKLLLLLALLPLGWYVQKRRRLRLPYPRIGRLGEERGGWGRIRVLWSPVLRSLALALLALTWVRSGSSVERIEEVREGIGIVVALDLSSSMLAEDAEEENRLQSAKRAFRGFVEERGADRIGLVAFAGEAVTIVPATLDHQLLVQAATGLKVGQLEDGTALGDGLATAVNRARELDVPSKVVVLLTDGDNNAGSIRPEEAAAAARSLGIRVHTIGVGREGTAPLPVERTDVGFEYETREVRVNEPLLRGIAEVTGGSYFRATDPDALTEIYRRIDAMEVAPYREVRTVERARVPREILAAALLLLLVEALGAAYGARRVLAS